MKTLVWRNLSPEFPRYPDLMQNIEHGVAWDVHVRNIHCFLNDFADVGRSFYLKKKINLFRKLYGFVLWPVAKSG